MPCRVLAILLLTSLVVSSALGQPDVSELRTRVLFNDSFNALFAPSGNWVHRQADTKAKLTSDGRLTFDPVGTMAPNGDIFTNRSFISSTNQFLLRFDYAGTAACDQVYVAWFYGIPTSEAIIPIHGWAATSRPDYCAQTGTNFGGCDQNFQLLLPTTSTSAGDMQRYEFVLALANFQVVSRNETAIAKGIYLSLQNRGYTGDVCFFDNFSFEEILPPLDPPSVAAPLLAVDFPMRNPSFLATSPQEEGTEISADFVRMVELQSDYRVKVIRNFPATGYKVQAASDGVVRFSRALQVYDESVATCDLTIKAFSQEGHVNTGLSKFKAPKNSVEWSISLTDWPFTTPNNTLLLEFGLSIFESGANTNTSVGAGQFVITNATYVPGEKTYRYVLRLAGSNASTVVNLILPTVATVDSTAGEIEAPVLTTAAAFAAYIGNSNSQPVSSLQADVGEMVDVVVFVFPSFRDSLIYDPNVGFLLTGGDESGGGDDNTLLIVLTTVLVSCALLVVIAAAVAAFIAMKVKANRINQEACVQLDLHDEASDAL